MECAPGETARKVLAAPSFPREEAARSGDKPKLTDNVVPSWMGEEGKGPG